MIRGSIAWLVELPGDRDRMEWAAVRGMFMRRIGSIALWFYVSTAHADGLGGAVGAATDQVLRGLTQSDHQVSWQADLNYAHGGWYGGLTGYGVRRGQQESSGVGLTAYTGYEQPFGDDWRGSAMVR